MNGFLFDGFPRTIPQADALIHAGIDLDFVLEILVPDEEIIRRLSGRRVHPNSGRVYHTEFNPPKKEGADDETGEPLVQRDDDSIETIKHRLRVYHEQTFPLVEFYQSLTRSSHLKYVSVCGIGSVEEITKSVLQALEN